MQRLSSLVFAADVYYRMSWGFHGQKPAPSSFLFAKWGQRHPFPA